MIVYLLWSLGLQIGIVPTLDSQAKEVGRGTPEQCLVLAQCLLIPKGLGSLVDGFEVKSCLFTCPFWTSVRHESPRA